MLRHIKTLRHSLKSPARQRIVVIDGSFVKGQPAVQHIWQLPGAHPATETAMQAAQPTTGDPLDTALAAFATAQGARQPSHPPLHSLPFSHATGMSGNLWHSGSEYILAVKGAPEPTLARCDLTESERERAGIQLHQLAASGHHVVALARRTLGRPITSPANLTSKEKLEFIGLVALAEPPRPGVRPAILRALRKGTAVYLITGSHPETAYSHGRQLGLVHRRGQVFDAQHLDVISEAELEKAIGSARIFSRASPKHRQRIVNALKNRGTIVTPASPEEL